MFFLLLEYVYIVDLESSRFTVLNGTYPKVCFILLVSENRSDLSFPAAYDLMITLGPRNYKIADKAAMVTTVFLHEGMYTLTIDICVCSCCQIKSAQPASACYTPCSYLMINSDNEHSCSKRCNNCSGMTFRPRRSSSGTKLRVTGKDWSLYTVRSTC